MKGNVIATYFLNCFLLTLPILFWNLLFASDLPGAYQPAFFWNQIPTWLTYSENTLRILVFLITLLMPIQISTTIQKRGLLLYLTGMLLYFAAWLMLMFVPDSNWSQSMAGFTAPAWTPLLWLLGIGRIGSSFYFGLPFRRWIFILVSILFLFFHNLHTVTIYLRLH